MVARPGGSGEAAVLKLDPDSEVRGVIDLHGMVGHVEPLLGRLAIDFETREARSHQQSERVRNVVRGATRPERQPTGITARRAVTQSA